MLKLCKKATGMVLSFILVLGSVFSAIKRVNIEMVIDCHRFVSSKDIIIFLLKEESLIYHFPTMLEHKTREADLANVVWLRVGRVN